MHAYLHTYRQKGRQVERPNNKQKNHYFLFNGQKQETTKLSIKRLPKFQVAQSKTDTTRHEDHVTRRASHAASEKNLQNNKPPNCQ